MSRFRYIVSTSICREVVIKCGHSVAEDVISKIKEQLQSEHQEEVLYLLSVAHLQLGNKQEANQLLQILSQSSPHSPKIKQLEQLLNAR